MRPSHIAKTVTLLDQNQWRHPGRPIIQIGAPYPFIADEPVYVNQMPPFNRYRNEPRPGLAIGGRFPIHVWARWLNWGFEWWGVKKDLVLRRGESWFHLRFE